MGEEAGTLKEKCLEKEHGDTKMEQGKNQKETEREEKQRNLNRFNSITQKQKPENQNQSHNVREEGIAPETRRR